MAGRGGISRDSTEASAAPAEAPPPGVARVTAGVDAALSWPLTSPARQTNTFNKRFTFDS